MSVSCSLLVKEYAQFPKLYFALSIADRKQLGIFGKRQRHRVHFLEFTYFICGCKLPYLYGIALHAGRQVAAIRADMDIVNRGFDFPFQLGSLLARKIKQT